MVEEKREDVERKKKNLGEEIKEENRNKEKKG